MLEQRLHDQNMEYLAYKEQMERDEYEFQLKIQVALDQTEEKFTTALKETDQALRQELRENVQMFNLDLRETEEKLHEELNNFKSEYGLSQKVRNFSRQIFQN